MKILVTPDSFKGTMSAQEVCLTIKQAILDIDPNTIVDTIPMADGGEGTVEALVYNLGGRILECKTTDALGNETIAKYGISKDNKIAIMEMAEAAGIIKISKLNPIKASTYGVGIMMLDAIDKGCKKILMGIGGSATNDGGIGMLSALGYRFYDKDNNLLKANGGNLEKIYKIDSNFVSPKLKDINIEVACDVDNILLGKNGATNVYGKQKGATKENLIQLEKGMENYCKVANKYLSKDLNSFIGGGAAGGLGAALVGFLDAKLEPGFEMVKNAVNLESTIQKNNYDYIITGEGQINHQTLCGKLPFGISTLGKKYNVKVIVIVGNIGSGYEAMFEHGMTSVFSTVTGAMSLDVAMKNGKNLLFDTVGRVYRLIR